MSFVSQLRREKQRLDTRSTGAVRGLYLKPEKRSHLQFAPIFLDHGNTDQARQTLNSALDGLYAANGLDNVDWYVERSLGLDVHGKIAWCNLDVTDLVVH